MRKVILGITGIILVFITWNIIAGVKDTPALPRAWDVIVCTIGLLGNAEYWTHIFASLKIVLWGIGIATALGIVLGITLSRFAIVNDVLMPFLDGIRGVSGLSLLPLLIILVGIDSPSRIIVIIWTAWPAVMFSTIHALSIDQSVVEAGQIDGANKSKIMFSMQIPIGLPGIMNGIRIGSSGGWISLIAAEMLGATRGLGYFLLYSSQSFHFAEVYATIVVIALLGGTMNRFLYIAQTIIERRLEGNVEKNEVGIRNGLDSAVGNGIVYGVQTTITR